MSDPAVVVLAGGTGGAKLARGMLDAAGAERLTVIANTGDDIDIYGASVSPDPDLVCWWLTDRIDARGYGIEGDTFTVMEALRATGGDTWFELGDRDLGWCLRRRELLDAGLTPTQALARMTAVLGIEARVVPATDQQVRTRIRSGGRWLHFQEFMVRERAAPPIEGVQFRGAERAHPSPAALEALAGADAVLIGPSNPIISIGPMLALPRMREALRAAPGAVVAVSPIVGGRVLKGPTVAFMQHAGLPLSAAGVAAHYDGLLDGIVTDEEEVVAADLPVLRMDTEMGDPTSRRQVAEAVLGFALALA